VYACGLAMAMVPNHSPTGMAIYRETLTPEEVTLELEASVTRFDAPTTKGTSSGHFRVSHTIAVWVGLRFIARVKTKWDTQYRKFVTSINNTCRSIWKQLETEEKELARCRSIARSLGVGFGSLGTEAYDTLTLQDLLALTLNQPYQQQLGLDNTAFLKKIMELMNAILRTNSAHSLVEKHLQELVHLKGLCVDLGETLSRLLRAREMSPAPAPAPTTLITSGRPVSRFASPPGAGGTGAGAGDNWDGVTWAPPRDEMTTPRGPSPPFPPVVEPAVEEEKDESTADIADIEQQVSNMAVDTERVLEGRYHPDEFNSPRPDFLPSPDEEEYPDEILSE